MPELLDDVEDGHLLLDAETRLVPQLRVHVRLADHVEAHLERLLRRRVLLHAQQGVTLALVNLKSTRCMRTMWIREILKLQFHT